jgi:hypothetical protein
MLELGEVADVLTGVSIREDKNGSARFVRLSDLSDLKAGRNPALARGEAPAVASSATDICIANAAAFGAYVSLDVYLLRPNKTKVNPQYLVAFLTLPATQALLAGGKQGSSLARLPKDALEKTEVPLPPMNVQRLIAGLACSVDKEDELLKKLSDLNSTLGRETIARAIRAADTRQFSQGVLNDDPAAR